jgi:DNA/RNA endonuclease YhcR with UshA esterase domain
MMKRNRATGLVAAMWLATSAAAYAGVPRLQSYQAKNHFRETATVCGVVVSTKYAESSRRSPTFLDLDNPYPTEPFTIVIWGTDRAKFGTPEATYAGKRVCVTGTIQDYRGKPEIIATDPSQIVTQ